MIPSSRCHSATLGTIQQLLAVTALCAGALLSSPMLSEAQCPFDWKPGNALPGLDNTVEATVVYDDGSGPALYAAGQFTSAGGVSANRIAKWDGTSWSPLGSGMDNTVSALTVYNGALIAGGNFTTAGGVSASKIARWNGSTWSALDAGMNGNGVFALTVYNGLLIAGGNFTTAGADSANRIAQWDGVQWSPLTSGVDGIVRALSVYNGALVAAGGFSTAGGNSANNIARWNGSAWSALNSGVGGDVKTLTVFNSSLIAGGGFDTAGGVGAQSIAQWDGSNWSALGSGIGLFPLNPSDVVLALAVHNGSLVAGGSFGGFARIARWDGSNWSTLGDGLDADDRALAVFNGALIAGGAFLSNNSGAGAPILGHIAQFVGGIWSGLGNGLPLGVAALASSNNMLIAGGAFTAAGGISANKIAQWNGSTWSPLGSGMGADALHQVYSLTVYNGALIAGGDFPTAGGVTVNGIAQWDGSSWSPLGSGMNGTVYALAVYNGTLFAGGTFTTAGGVSVNRIAQWNGSNWSAVGTLGLVIEFHTLAVYDGELIAGGHFAPNIAKWNGTSWSFLGSGTNNDVNALTIYNEELIAGGTFTRAGGVSGRNRIAKWDGSNWSGLGSGLDNEVYALTVYDGALVAGGLFTTAGGSSASRIARWNGSTWSAMGGGMDNTVSALTGYGGDLVAGGSFSSAGGTASASWARWGLIGSCPEIAVEQPLGTNVADGGARDFGAVPLDGNTSLSFTIMNIGNIDLTGLGVSIDGPDAGMFALTASPTAPVSGHGGSTTLTMRFAPDSGGARTAALHIANNDADEDPYDINLSGTGIGPEITVEQPAGTSIADGGSAGFGSVAVSANSSLTFTIKNVGNVDLTGLGLSIDGIDAAQFAVTASPTAPVSGPNGSTTFTVRFSPSGIGAKAAALHIANNDLNENPFDINLSGTGTGAEIVVEQPPGSDIADGGSATFGAVAVSGNASLSFTVKNIGNVDLTGLGVTIDGADATSFALTVSPTAPVSGPNGSTTLTVRFAPTSVGVKAAALHIANNDLDENPFDINLNGTGTAPEIAVEQPPGANIPDGGSQSFGIVAVGWDASVTFTIKNTGTGDLTGLSITIDGADAALFTVTAGPTAPVSGPTGSTTFTVRFAPTASGVRTAALHIANNDLDEDPFDINLTGSGTTAEIVVEQPVNLDVPDGGSRSYGNVVVTGPPGQLIFLLRNIGIEDLTVLPITIDGPDASMFPITDSPTTPIGGPNGTATITVRFIPTTPGAKTAALHIANNDADENPFDINLSGTGLAPEPEVRVEQPLGTNVVDGGPGFLPKTSFSTGNDPASVAIADVSGDGKPDLAVANRSSNTVSVLLGNGTGGFGPKTDFSTGSGPSSVAIADVSGDNQPDLAVTNQLSNTVSVLLGNGAGSFGPKTDFATQSAPLSVAIRDVSGDGKPDLAVANFNTSSVSVRLGNGTGGFGPRTDFSTGTGPASVAIGDVSGDGKPDLALANRSANTVSRLLGNGVGGFAPKTDFTTGSGPSSVTIGDVNGDGKPDLAVANSTDNSVSVLLGNGTGGFGPKSDFAAGSGPSSVAIGDLNGDGKSDLALANGATTTISMLLGDGTGGFGPKTDFTGGNNPSSVAIADLSGDGVLDLAVAGNNQVSVLLGTATFGSVTVGGNASVTFTIKNTGFADLTGLGITVDGTDAAMFSITTSPTAPVSGPSGSTTFVVEFDPSSAGVKTAALHIANNDTDENPFDINLRGTGAGPEIGVEQPLGTNIADGGARDFGSVGVSGNLSLTFTIKNTGNVDLTGLGIAIDGPDAAMFTITASPTPPVSGPSGSTTFAVRFAPTSAGVRSAALHIASNDADENPFDLNLSGTGTGPEIVVEQPAGSDIADGDEKNFGSVAVGGDADLSFIIKNTGNDDLTGLDISIDGTDSALFTVISDPVPPVSGPTGSTSFTVRFAPISTGAKTASLHVASNDFDENPFDIDLSGMGDDAVGVPGDASVAFSLEGARPNPSRGQDLVVGFALPAASGARLELLDVRGRRVLAREVGTLGVGRHTVNLAEGQRVAHGVYWLRLVQGANRRVACVVVLE